MVKSEGKVINCNELKPEDATASWTAAANVVVITGVAVTNAITAGVTAAVPEWAWRLRGLLCQALLLRV